MTGEEKLASVERQFYECARGESDVIVCPYCLTHNREEDRTLCCATFGKAIAAVLQHDALGQLQDQMERVYEQAAKN